jgi:hypothetical protein
MPTRKKPSFAKSNAIKSLGSSKISFNLIDGEEELFGKEETKEQNKTIEPVVKEVEKPVDIRSSYKTRHNIPVYDDQYFQLQAISKISGLNITDLVREAINKVISESEEKFGSRKIVEMIDILQKIKKP